MPHVFLSYVREDSAMVDRIAKELQGKNVPVWLDRLDIAPGQRWQNAIRDAIQNGDYFLACFSSAYVNKARSYMNEELTVAIEELRQRPTDRAWFIPLLLSECQIPDRQIGAGETLRAIQHIPLYLEWDRGMQSLVSVLQSVVPKAQYQNGLQSIAETRLRELLNKLNEPDPDDNPYQPQMHSVAEQIAALGGSAVPFLIAQFKPAMINPRILVTLRKMGAVAGLAAPHILRNWDTLRQTDRERVRDVVIFTLGELRNPVAIPFLLDELHRPESTCRERTIAALGLIGDPSVTSDLIAQLLGWQAPPRFSVLDKPFPFAAADALIAIGEAVVSGLHEVLSSSATPSPATVRIACVLSKLDHPRKRKWRSIVQAAINQGAGVTAVEALCALRVMGRPTPSLVSAAIKASQAEDAHVRFLATSYLYSYCDRSPRVITALRERETDPEYAVASAARGDVRG